MAKHIKWPSGSKIFGEVDWDKLAETTRKAVRFLDDLVQVNLYIPSIPELKDAAWKGRRIGLGYMGLADVLMAIGARYGSREGIDATSEITAWMHYHAMMASVELAKERGPFPAIQGSIFDPQFITWIAPRPTKKVSLRDWQDLYHQIKTNGIRNCAVTTLAPTGTIGTMVGVEGYGIEPAFAIAYSRRVTQPDGTTMRLKYASPLFARACAIAGVEPDSEAYQKALETGSCQGIEGIPLFIQQVFVTSGDLNWEEHVAMQAAAQTFLSNSVSKTINFPSGATKQDVLNAFVRAWKSHCCGLTVYVEGSRDAVVLQK